MSKPRQNFDSGMEPKLTTLPTLLCIWFVAEAFWSEEVS